MMKRVLSTEISLLILLLCGFLGRVQTGFSENPVSPVGLPLYYWTQPTFVNFGDYLSLKLVERIVSTHVPKYIKKRTPQKKLLAVGSILTFAADGDVIWGSGINGKRLSAKDYAFTHLDIRAVRGPLTRQFLMDVLHLETCPEGYGDPALLVPYFFPEFVRKKHPSYEYLIIPHYSEIHLFPLSEYPNVIYPTAPWNEIIEKMMDSKFVISSSLHGIIVAEAFGIPSRLLRITENEPLFKYADYYLGTNRPDFQYATSVEEALQQGGEKPFECDLEKLYLSFPFEFWQITPQPIQELNLSGCFN